MSILVAVHTLALLSVPLLMFGFVGVTMRAGWHRPEALLAFIIYALSAVAIMFAGIADGLINAALIPEMTGASDLKLQALKAALSYNFQFNQACAKVLSLVPHLPLFFGQSPSLGLECLSDELELSAVYQSGRTVWLAVWLRSHVRSWFRPHCLAASGVGNCPGCVDASHRPRRCCRYTRRGSSVSHCPLHDPLAPLPIA